jgi:hypothetical protein
MAKRAKKTPKVELTKKLRRHEKTEPSSALSTPTRLKAGPDLDVLPAPSSGG